MGILTWTAVYRTCKNMSNVANHVRVRSGILNGPFWCKHMLKTIGIGVISTGNDSKKHLDNKALALPNVKNLRRLLIYQLGCLTIELLPAILIVMQHS